MIAMIKTKEKEDDGSHHHHHQWHDSPESGRGLPYGFRDDITMWVISSMIDLVLVNLIRLPETSRTTRDI
jgi:hypothetical protein